MVLRKLTIFGFKSFADKTELTFGEGITVTIGPNGCGKSNVVDAIRWVFGEQKPTALRGASMQDVIFSGTQKRSPLNMAEVTLTIENNRGILPVDYNEISITRRVFRNEDSEYRINKVPCRLRDIQNLFLDTGLGSSAYTTIENSMINTILSEKVEEKRVLFEEAAGIGKYKQRRKESLRQLDKTKQDLLRINDKVQEADRQVRILGNQLEKVKRYKRYHADLKGMEIAFENRRYVQLKDGVAQRTVTIGELSAAIETARAKLAAADSRIETLRLHATEQEVKLGAASEDVAAQNDAINATDKEISVSRERKSFLQSTLDRLEQERLSCEESIAKNSELRLKIEKGIVEQQTTRENYQEQTATARDELNRFDARMQECRSRADELSRSQIELIRQNGQQQTDLNSLTTNLNNCLGRIDRLDKEIVALENRLSEYQDSATASRAQLKIISESHQNLLQSREALLGRIEAEDKRYQQLMEREKTLEASIDSGKSKLSFLEGLDSSFEGYESGVKSLLQHRSAGTVGSVAELFTVSNEAQAALIERMLGSALQTVVFDTDASLALAALTLKEQKAGYASMVSLERLNKISAPQIADNGTAQSLRSAVTVAPEHTVVADHLLCTLFVADSATAALEASLSLGRTVTVAARDLSVVCHGSGIVHAGQTKREQVGILQRKQQIEKLHGDLARNEKEHQVALHDKEICQITREEARYALVEVDEKLNRESREQQEQETNIKHYENEIQTIVERLHGIRAEHIDLTRQRGEFDLNITASNERREELAQNLTDIETQLTSSKEELSRFESERTNLDEHARNVELALMQVNHRITQDTQDVARLGNDIKIFEQRKNNLAGEALRATEGARDITTALQSLADRLIQQKEARTVAENRRDTIREGYNGLLAEIDDQNKALKIEQSGLDETSNRHHAFDIEQTRDEQEVRAIRTRMWEAYEIDMETPPEDLPPVEGDDTMVVENIQVLKERLKRVGQVNMAAEEDYEAESKRLNEFTTQRDDLQKAMDDLDVAIKKLDREAREQFVTTFKQVQTNFIKMFTMLFEGGEAQLTMDENVDPLEAAIHINVRPAGKKMRGVQLLSGGERALTAISLLFALYMVKPSPYCILDELDAPLDDANIGRFVGLLKTFAQTTQFIVITHNKRTMEAADVLYGVTQQEKGVSTIVSVKFEEAVAQAA